MQASQKNESILMKLLCRCLCCLNRGHPPGTHAVGETDVISALKRRESLQALQAQQLGRQARGRQHDSAQGHPMDPGCSRPPGRHHSQTRVRAGGCARDRAVGVGPGGSPAASAARSAVSRPPNSQPIRPLSPQPSRHRESHKPAAPEQPFASSLLLRFSS